MIPPGPVYEKWPYWVANSRQGGFDVFQIKGCASVNVAQCHVPEGLEWCKREIDRRISAKENAK